MAAPLYRRHSAALTATYDAVERHAAARPIALIGTPGAITLRRNSAGLPFHVRQFYDHAGRKRDQYLAAASHTGKANTRLDDCIARVREARETLGLVRLLSREGYATLAPRQFAVLAALGNQGLFRAGAVMVGSHAFRIIANRMGIRAASAASDDLDIALPVKLTLEDVPTGGMLEMLGASGIEFVEGPAGERGGPATSLKEKGRSRLSVHLLVPASGNEIHIEHVPELKARASAMPHLRYLTAVTEEAAIVSTHGVARVRVPLAGCFALHKLLVAQLRTGKPQKSAKDLQQAAVLIAALGELHRGALTSAYERTPVPVRRHIRAAVRQIKDRLVKHPQAWEELAHAAQA